MAELVLPLQLTISTVLPGETKGAAPVAVQTDQAPREAVAAESIATVEGHASVFDVLDLGGDIVRPGAFTRSIAEFGQQVPIFWEHSHSLFGKGDSLPIGVTTLLEEDSRGLFFRADLADTTKARDVMALMETLELRSSIGFDVFEGGLTETESGIREFTDLKLLEISIVTWPMNTAATARLAGKSVADIFAAGVERFADMLGG